MNANEQALLIAQLAVEREAREDLEARVEQAIDLLRTQLETRWYVDTEELRVVSEVVSVLAGEEA